MAKLESDWHEWLVESPDDDFRPIRLYATHIADAAETAVKQLVMLGDIRTYQDKETPVIVFCKNFRNPDSKTKPFPEPCVGYVKHTIYGYDFFGIIGREQISG